MRIPAAVLALALSTPVTADPGRSRVVDRVTNEPIQGATVSIGCKRYGFIHGSETLREMVKVSDENGWFSVSAGEARGCDWFAVHAKKEGYGLSDTTPGPVDRLPDTVLLPKLEDVGMVHLQELAWVLHIINPQKSRERTLAVFTAFRDSVRVAKTPREKKFIYDGYCDLLLSLDDELSPSDREWLTRANIGYGANPHYNRELVAEFCKANAG